MRWMLCILLSTVTLAVHAADENILTLKPEIQRGDMANPKGLWPMFGVGMGVMDNNGSSRTSGVPTQIKVLGSYYFDSNPWVTDFGVGLHNEFLVQSGSGANSIQSLYSELAARYILTNRWQLGAIWNTLVDNTRRYESKNDNLASFVGAQILKEFSWNDDYLVRVGGRAMTSLGLNGGSVDTVMAELEVSFGSGSKVAPQMASSSSERVPVTAPQLDTEAMQIYRTQYLPVQFNAQSTKLTGRSEAYFTNLARVLADNHQLFEHVELTGLNKRRARAVIRELSSVGVRSGRVSEPMHGGSHHVRLEFRNVRNQAALKNIIDSVPY